MKWFSLTLIKILIAFISFFCIDGGKSLLLLSTNEDLVQAYDKHYDIEVPHQHHFANFFYEEKWLDSLNVDFSCINKDSVKYSIALIPDSQDFSASIWQPPKAI